MVLITTILFISSFIIVKINFCNGYGYSNSTDDFSPIEKVFQSIQRESRLFKYKNDDQSVMELEFKMPFVKVPVRLFEESASSIMKGMAEGNTMENMLSVVQNFLGFNGKSDYTFFSNYLPADKIQSQFRYEETSIWDVFDDLDIPFHAYTENLKVCLQKAICILVKKSTVKVKNKKGSSSEKLIDGITSSYWLLNALSGTTLKNAIVRGREESNCNIEFSACRLNGNQLLGFLGKL